MKLPLNEIGKICVRDPTQLVARAIEASYLKQIIEEGEKELRTASATRLLQLLPDYSRYNKNNDVCWDELKEVEALMNILLAFDTLSST